MAVIMSQALIGGAPSAKRVRLRNVMFAHDRDAAGDVPSLERQNRVNNRLTFALSIRTN
jgi:hypothetical protein